MELGEIVFFHRSSRTATFAGLSKDFSDAFLDAHWTGIISASGAHPGRAPRSL